MASRVVVVLRITAAMAALGFLRALRGRSRKGLMTGAGAVSRRRTYLTGAEASLPGAHAHATVARIRVIDWRSAIVPAGRHRRSVCFWRRHWRARIVLRPGRGWIGTGVKLMALALPLARVLAHRNVLRRLCSRLAGRSVGLLLRRRGRHRRHEQRLLRRCRGSCRCRSRRRDRRGRDGILLLAGLCGDRSQQCRGQQNDLQ
jgi:hypothetical protein